MLIKFSKFEKVFIIFICLSLCLSVIFGAFIITEYVRF